MRFLIRLGILVAQFIVFVFATWGASVGVSRMQAETYAAGARPADRFPVVAVEARPGAAPAHTLLRWRDLEEARRARPGLRFILPEAQGRFDLEPSGSFTPSAGFRVLENAGARQRVEVRWTEDNFELVSRYATDGSAIQPAYLRRWGPGEVFIGIVPGLIAAWLFGRILRTRLRKPAA